MNHALYTLADLSMMLAQIVPEYKPSLLPPTTEDPSYIAYIAIGVACLAFAVILLIKLRRRRHRRHYTDR